MEKFKKIAVLGAGAWGTALGKVLADSGQNCLLWSKEDFVVEEINTLNSNLSYCGSTTLPESLKATTNLYEAICDADVILLAVPTFGIKDVVNHIIETLKENNLNKKYVFISAAKGFSPEKTLISDYLDKVIPAEIIADIAVLIGPSLAIEVLESKLTKVSLISKNIACAKKLQAAFCNSYFNTTVETDVQSCEYASILKNIYAILSGMYNGLGNQFNTIGWLITNIVSEMREIIKMKGGDPDVVYRLVGLGDLMVTATNEKSRNFSIGVMLAKTQSLKAMNRKIQQLTIEGYYSSKIFYESFSKTQLKRFPMLCATYEILYKQANLSKTLDKLFKELV